MGIRYLNSFFKEEATQAIKLISLKQLSGKKIAIDISIYMYKYASENSLIENIYLMLSVLRHYNIIPIFIFDGKPPVEKKELLQKRKEDKKAAESEYAILQNKLLINEEMDEIEKQEIMTNMDLLKRKFVNINKKDIEMVKRLIRAYGATYYDAPGESDEICALLTIKGKVWATMSEDMDMFVYGCPRVIRYISLLNHSAVLYDTKRILEILGITQKDLREICVLSGTDYNSVVEETKNSPNLYTTLKYFKKFFKAKMKEENNQNQYNNQQNNEFYEWLVSNNNYIKDLGLLQKICNIFDLTKNHENIKRFEDIKISNSVTLKEEIVEILKTDGFIFPCE
jgi:flap endonuclease-1